MFRVLPTLPCCATGFYSNTTHNNFRRMSVGRFRHQKRRKHLISNVVVSYTHARNPASIARECRTSDARDQKEQAIYIFQPSAVLAGFSQLPTLNFPRTPCGALQVIQWGGVSLNDSKPIRQGEYTSCAGVSSGNVGFSILRRAPGVSPGRGNDDRQAHIMRRTIAILGMKLPRLRRGRGHRAHS